MVVNKTRLSNALCVSDKTGEERNMGHEMALKIVSNSEMFSAIFQNMEVRLAFSPASLCTDNAFLNEIHAGIPQRSPDETRSLSSILPLEIYTQHSGAAAIIQQLQFHMATLFEIEERRGGRSSKEETCQCWCSFFLKCWAWTPLNWPQNVPFSLQLIN